MALTFCEKMLAKNLHVLNSAVQELLEMIIRVLICILTTVMVVVTQEYQKDTSLKHFAVFSNVMYPTNNHLIGNPNHVTLEACAELCFQSSSIMNKVEFSERHNRRSIDMFEDVTSVKLRKKSMLGSTNSDSNLSNGMSSAEMCWSFQYITGTGHCLLLNDSAAFELRGYDTLKPATGTTYYELSRSNFGLYANKPGFVLRSENPYTVVVHNTTLEECVSACVTSPNLTCNSFVYSRELHVCAKSDRIAETKTDLMPTTIYDMYQYAGVWPCNVTFLWEYTPRVIASQSYPYVHDRQVTCNFRIIAPPGGHIQLTVMAFFTNQSQCTNNVDGVYIYGGRSDSMNFSRKLCQVVDNGLQESVISYSGTMDVRISQQHNIVITRLLYEFIPDIHHDVCFQNKCINNSKCEPYGTGYTCICSTRNLTGALCELSVGNCFSNPCLFNGKCVPTGYSFLCVCPFGTTGNRCETFVGECERQPCVNGTCIPATSVSGFTCACQKGFTGETCEYNINECFSSPCIHGTCYDQIHGYQCLCEDSYTGQNCEIDKRLAACSRHECRFGACAVNSTGSYCQCFPGFTGYSCETNIDDCKSSPCAHGACVDHVNSYHCNCYEGFAGRQCNILKEDPCRVNQCLHGYCSVDNDGYSCVCETGYTGYKCESQIVDCNKNCVHGFCVQETGLQDIKCVCFANFTGDNCNIQLKECTGSYCFDNGSNYSMRPFSDHSTSILQTVKGVTKSHWITQKAQRTTTKAVGTTQDQIKHEATTLSSQFKVTSSASPASELFTSSTLPSTKLSALSTLLATELSASSTTHSTQLSISSTSRATELTAQSASLTLPSASPSVLPSTEIPESSTSLATELSASSTPHATELSASSTPHATELSASSTLQSASPSVLPATKIPESSTSHATELSISSASPTTLSLSSTTASSSLTVHSPPSSIQRTPPTKQGITDAFASHFELRNTTSKISFPFPNSVTTYIGKTTAATNNKYNLHTLTSKSVDFNKRTTIAAPHGEHETNNTERTQTKTTLSNKLPISTQPGLGIITKQLTTSSTVAGYPSQLSTGDGTTEVSSTVSVGVVSESPLVFTKTEIIPVSSTRFITSLNSNTYRSSSIPSHETLFHDTFSSAPVTPVIDPQIEQTTSLTTDPANQKVSSTQTESYTKITEKTTINSNVVASQPTLTMHKIITSTQGRREHLLLSQTMSPPMTSEHVTRRQTSFHNSKTTEYLTVRQTKSTEPATASKGIDSSKTTVYSAGSETITSPSKVGHVTEMQPMSDVSTITPSVPEITKFVGATSNVFRGTYPYFMSATSTPETSIKPLLTPHLNSVVTNDHYDLTSEASNNWRTYITTDNNAINSTWTINGGEVLYTNTGPGVTDSPNITSATFTDPVAVDLDSSISHVVTIESVLIGALFVILLIVIIVAVFIIYKKTHSGTVYISSESSVPDRNAKETSVKKRYSAREIHTDLQTGKLCRPQCVSSEMYQRQNYNNAPVYAVPKHKQVSSKCSSPTASPNSSKSGNYDEVESPNLAIPKSVRRIRPTIGKRVVNLSRGSGVISPKGHRLSSDDSVTHSDKGSRKSSLSSIENPFFKYEDGTVGLNLTGHHRSRTQEEFQSLLEEILDAEENVTVNRPGMRNTIYHITGTDGGKSEV